MLFNSPISSAKADLLIDLLELQSDSKVIDVGCGTGEFLTRVVKKYSAMGQGVDIVAQSLSEARENVERAGISDRINFLEKDIRELDFDEPFDCGICLGATHAYSMGETAYTETLQGLGAVIKSGGLLLIGEGFWNQEPVQDYIDFVGQPIGTYRSHRENVELASDFDLLPLYATTSSLDEWDDFEWRHQMRMEKSAEEDPENEALRKKRDFGRAWRSGYLKWGREVMGFGFYLFKKV